MEATELRIGNLIWNPVQNIPVEVDFRILNQIHIRNKQKDKIFDSEFDWQPILLREEWLLKFGFNFKLNESYINGKEWTFQVTGERLNSSEINEDYTWFNGIGNWGWFKEKTMSVNTLCRGNYVCKSVSTVHELQNLFYSLSKKDLKLINDESQ